MPENDLPPIPAPQGRTERGNQLIELTEARRICVEAIFQAEDREREAAAARRRAHRLRKSYERLLMEYSGQMRLPGT